MSLVSTVTREQVGLALFALLTGSATYASSSRRFTSWTQVTGAQKPALFQVEHREQHVKKQLITPAVRTLDIDVFIFINAGQDPNITPVSVLNPLIDAIDPTSGGCLAPDRNGRQTLGGLVTDCYIDGEIIKPPGDQNGIGMAVIPVKVVFMQP